MRNTPGLYKDMDSDGYYSTQFQLSLYLEGTEKECWYKSINILKADLADSLFNENFSGKLICVNW